MDSIKTLRLELELPMISDSKVESVYGVDSMLRGSHKPNYRIIDGSDIVDMIKVLCRYSDSFLISEDQKSVCELYFIHQETMKNIALQADVNYDNVKKLILRMKNKAKKVLCNQTKKSDLERLLKNDSFVEATSI